MSSLQVLLRGYDRVVFCRAFLRLNISARFSLSKRFAKWYNVCNNGSSDDGYGPSIVAKKFSFMLWLLNKTTIPTPRVNDSYHAVPWNPSG